MTKKYLIWFFALFIIMQGLVGARFLMNSLSPIFKMIDLALVLFLISVGVFLLRLRNWARVSAIIIALFYIMMFIGYVVISMSRTSLLDAKATQGVLTVKLLFHLVMYILVMLYFTRPKIKEQFK